MNDPDRPISAVFVCGGRYHDMDFARVEILRLLAEDPSIRTRVFEDFRNIEALSEADLLVTYTCDVRVSETEEQALAEFVSRGGRWFALHGTNSVMDFVAAGVAAPRIQQTFMRTLGSQFVAHPPIGTFEVRSPSAGHPLVQGLVPFEVEDELYLCETLGDLEVLLETSFSGSAPGFVEGDWPGEEARAVMYLHPVGQGEVLYLTLGHCRGRYDMKPVMDVYPVVERGAWESPVFTELVRRGLRWSVGGVDAV